jgi:DNA repair photolyase
MAENFKTMECKRVLKRVKPSSKFKCTYQALPYVGCSFGCLYCSQSIDRGHDQDEMDSKGQVFVKINAPEILKNELKRARSGLVCICGYQPLEREQRIIRQLLDVLAARALPVHIVVKSEVLLDDMDVIRRTAENNFCSVTLCINTLDNTISKTFEPNTPSPKVRMDALGQLAKAGITTGLAIMPVIPYITDSDEQLEELIRTAAKKKARYVLFDTLRLEDNYRGSVIMAIKRHYPEIIVKYRRLYEFGATPESLYTRQLRARMRQLLAKYGLEGGVPYHDVDRKVKQIKLEKYQ